MRFFVRIETWMRRRGIRRRAREIVLALVLTIAAAASIAAALWRGEGSSRGEAPYTTAGSKPVGN
jgi:hypothetical protein